MRTSLQREISPASAGDKTNTIVFPMPVELMNLMNLMNLMMRGAKPGE